MKVNYCDLCGVPLKDGEYFTLYIASPVNKENAEAITNYYDYLAKVEKEVKDICPSCKKLMNEMFKLRLQNLNQISDELFGIYDLSPKKAKRNDKNNK